MQYEPIFEDAPSPTPHEMDSSRRYHQKMGRFMWIEIILSLFGLIVFPILMGAAGWWWVGSIGEGVFPRIFLVVALFCTSLMGVLVFWPKGRLVRAEDYQMFHCAEKPLSSLQWLEIEGLLKRHPEEKGRVSDWIAKYDGDLRLRHLWALRRVHSVHHFDMGIVENCDAISIRGKHLREKFYDQDEPVVGPRDILGGQLMALLDGYNLKTQVNPATGTGRAARL